MAVADMTLTEFLRQSGAALKQVDTSDLRLHRRDGEDLYLKRADREEAEHASLAAAGAVLARMLRVPAVSDEMATVVVDAMPWTRFLPIDDRADFVAEFTRTIEACVDLNNFAPVGTMLKQWKTTAEVWADPALRAALDADIDEGRVAERPPAAG